MQTLNIDEYGDKEEQLGKQIHKDLISKNNEILNARAIYPEYDLRSDFGLHRPGVNIISMLFLYPQVIAYVPRVSKKKFDSRYGVDYDTFLHLWEEKLLFPVLNHPNSYRDPIVQSELREILMKMPPTWERWHSALKEANDNLYFKNADEIADLSLLSKEGAIKEAFKKKLATTDESKIINDIVQQIRNNYTNLRLIGMHDRADSILRDINEKPLEAFNELMTTSDFYAYSKVMGGGVSNINLSNNIPMNIRTNILQLPYLKKHVQYFDADVLDALLNGFKFAETEVQVSVDFFKEWHHSNQGKTARKAYNSLIECVRKNNRDIELIYESIKEILNQQKEFNSVKELTNKNVTKKKKTINFTSNLVGLLCTILGIASANPIVITGSTILGGGISLYGMTNLGDRRKILYRILKKEYPALSVELVENMTKLNSFFEQKAVDMLIQLNEKEEKKIKLFNNTWHPSI